MDLRTYLFNHRISVTEFSKELGCSRMHLSDIKNGRRIPGLSLAKLIEIKTNGQVSVNELLNPNISED